LMALINAKPHPSAQGVVDGFVIWECDSSSLLETNRLAKFKY
jgi:hypothetical protein